MTVSSAPEARVRSPIRFRPPGGYALGGSPSSGEAAMPEPERSDQRRAALIAYDLCRRALIPAGSAPGIRVATLAMANPP